jgi:hypothetical protein
VLENDIIMRLCRLDDDEKSNHSLREALRSIETTIPQSEGKAIRERLSAYRKLINPLKTKARNYYLAHMSKHAEEPLDPIGDLERSNEAVVNLVDSIAGGTIQYEYRVGSHKGETLDLRDELSKKST